MNPHELRNKIVNRSAHISVIGQGYIGLPLSLLLADSGFSVIGYDVDSKLIEELSSGITRLRNEKKVGDLLLKHLGSRYFPSNDRRRLKGSDVIIVAVPTPKVNGTMELGMLMDAIRLASSTINRGGLIVVESTLPPKTFDILLSEIGKAGLMPGEDVFISYCPERAMPGKLIEELIFNYRIIGAKDPISVELSKILYKCFVKGEIEITDPLTAEIAKLVENAYRDVNIAFANEVARICEALGSDVREVRELVNKHPRVKMLLPGIGVGGSCLTKDPLFLSWVSRENGYSPELIKIARELNESMPIHYADLVDDFIRWKNSGNGIVCVLGVTYKGNVADTRESPAKYLIDELMRRGHKVKVHDPILRESFGARFYDRLEEAVKDADVIVIVSNHSEFKGMDLGKIRELAGRDPVLLLDGRLVIDKEKAEASGFIYASVGNLSSLRRIRGETLALSETISKVPL
jgi:UDP-N-acetyl-D-mannosaminuronic acid dehydrogenase